MPGHEAIVGATVGAAGLPVAPTVAPIGCADDRLDPWLWACRALFDKSLQLLCIIDNNLRSRPPRRGQVVRPSRVVSVDCMTVHSPLGSHGNGAQRRDWSCTSVP